MNAEQGATLVAFFDRMYMVVNRIIELSKQDAINDVNFFKDWCRDFCFNGDIAKSKLIFDEICSKSHLYNALLPLFSICHLRYDGRLCHFQVSPFQLDDKYYLIRWLTEYFNIMSTVHRGFRHQLPGYADRYWGICCGLTPDFVNDLKYLGIGIMPRELKSINQERVDFLLKEWTKWQDL